MMVINFISLTLAGKDLAQAAVLSAVVDTSPLGAAIFKQSLDAAKEFSLPKGAQLVAASGDVDFSGVD